MSHPASCMRRHGAGRSFLPQSDKIFCGEIIKIPMVSVPRPIRILVVDDDKRLNRALEFKLSQAGFLTKSAFDGESAIQILEKEKFDLIILDLVMPGTPGFDVLIEIKRRNLGTPVVVLSMLRQEEDVKRARELGASEYFLKSSPSYLDEIVKYAEKLSTS